MDSRLIPMNYVNLEGKNTSRHPRAEPRGYFWIPSNQKVQCPVRTRNNRNAPNLGSITVFLIFELDARFIFKRIRAVPVNNFIMRASPTHGCDRQRTAWHAPRF